MTPLLPAGSRGDAATSTGPLRRTIVVANPMGLHMRPATAFAQLARGCGCKVAVFLGDKRADGSNPFDLMLLIAEFGAELVLEVDGDGADQAVEALAAVLAAAGDGE